MKGRIAALTLLYWRIIPIAASIVEKFLNFTGQTAVAGDERCRVRVDRVALVRQRVQSGGVHLTSSHAVDSDAVHANASQLHILNSRRQSRARLQLIGDNNRHFPDALTSCRTSEHLRAKSVQRDGEVGSTVEQLYSVDRCFEAVSVRVLVQVKFDVCLVGVANKRDTDVVLTNDVTIDDEVDEGQHGRPRIAVGLCR